MTIPLDIAMFPFTAVRGVGQYRIVDANTSDFGVTYGSGGRALGVSQRDVNSGQTASVLLLGISRVIAGAAVTPGQYFTAQSGTGFALSVASGAAATLATGLVLTAAASGMIFQGFLSPTFINSGAPAL